MSPTLAPHPKQLKIHASPVIKDGAVVVVHGETPYEFTIKDPLWMQYALRPGAVTMMDPTNKAKLDEAYQKANTGKPHV